MAAKNHHKSLLKKLKKQVRILEKKEEKGRAKLQMALKKVRKLGRSYKSKLAAKARAVKAKLISAQASGYAKAAAAFERQLIKSLEAKGKALVSAVAKLDKKHMAKWSKNLAKKAGKGKRKAKKVASVKVSKVKRGRPSRRRGKRK